MRLYDRYGPPEVLRLADVGRPVPGRGELLVRVHATTVNRTDCHRRAADPFVWRFIAGLRRPRQRILGSEFAGVVDEVGAEVTDFAVCDGVLATLSSLRRVGLRDGQRILVYGASGSIGTAGVQLANYLGAHVTAVCDTNNVETVRSLNVDEVIDYLRDDFTGNFVLARWTARFGDRKVMFPVPPRITKADVLLLKEHMEAGRYRAVIDRSYPLADVVEATRYVETEQKTGNVVLRVAG